MAADSTLMVELQCKIPENIDQMTRKYCTLCVVEVPKKSYRSLLAESSLTFREYIEELGLEFDGYICGSCSNKIKRLQRLDFDIKTKVDTLKAARAKLFCELQELVNSSRKTIAGSSRIFSFPSNLRRKSNIFKRKIKVDEKKIGNLIRGLRPILPCTLKSLKPENSIQNETSDGNKKRTIENVEENVIPVKQVKTTYDVVVAEPASSEEPSPNKPVLLVRNYNAVTNNNLSLLLPNGTIQSDEGLTGITATDMASLEYAWIKQPQGQENKALESEPPRNGQSADKHFLTFSDLFDHENCCRKKLVAEGNTHSSNDSSCVEKTSVNDPLDPPKLYKLVMANPTNGSKTAMYGCALRLEEVGHNEQTYRPKSSFENVSVVSSSNMVVRNPKSVKDYVTSGNVPDLSQLLPKNTSQNIKQTPEHCNLPVECSHHSVGHSVGLSVQVIPDATSVTGIKSSLSMEQDIVQDKLTDVVNIKVEQEDEICNSECQKTESSNQDTDSNHYSLRCTEYSVEVDVKQEKSDEYNSQTLDQVVDSEMSLHCEKSDSSSKETDYSDKISVKHEHNDEYQSHFQQSESPLVPVSDPSLHIVKSDSFIPGTDGSIQVNIKQEPDAEFSSQGDKLQSSIPDHNNCTIGRKMTIISSSQLLKGFCKYAPTGSSETKHEGVEKGKNTNKQTSKCTGKDEPVTSKVKIGAGHMQCRHATICSSETKHETIEKGNKSNINTSECTGNSGKDESKTSRVTIGADLKQCTHALCGSLEIKQADVVKGRTSNKQTSEFTENIDMDEPGTSRVKIGADLKQCLSSYLSKKRKK